MKCLHDTPQLDPTASVACTLIGICERAARLPLPFRRGEDQGEGLIRRFYPCLTKWKCSERQGVIQSCCRIALLISALFFPSICLAHIGSPNVFFEGNAGPYPVRVVIRPPGVVPGLAEISVRIQSSDPVVVKVLP